MTKKIYILYQPGSYGSYLRWLIDYSNDIGHKHKSIPDNPTAEDGSAHYLDHANRHINGKSIFQTLHEFPENDCGYIIYRVLPVVHDENLTTDQVISRLIDNIRECDRIIYVDINKDFLREIVFINIELKTTHKETFNASLAEQMQRWGTSKDFYEADRWIQREVLSLWFRGMIDSLTLPPSRYSKVCYVDMCDILFGDSVDLSRRLLDFCDLPYRENVIDNTSNVHSTFVENQKALMYHRNMEAVLHDCLNGIESPIGPMSLFTEAILQERLLNKGYALKCYDLNELPKTTLELFNLLEKC